MRRLIYQMMVTLDGFHSGPEGEIDWHVIDEEFQLFSRELLESIDTLLFGRSTFELMENFWATELGKAADPIVAGYMNNLNKIVFSTTINTVNWKNTRLIKENIVEEIIKLKQIPGKDLAILGSSNLATSLAVENLIDEYRIIVNPIILGKGKNIFQGITNKKELKLIAFRNFKTGNVLLRYAAL